MSTHNGTQYLNQRRALTFAVDFVNVAGPVIDQHSAAVREFAMVLDAMVELLRVHLAPQTPRLAFLNELVMIRTEMAAMHAMADGLHALWRRVDAAHDRDGTRG